jgi:hypothetical protein
MAEHRVYIVVESNYDSEQIRYVGQHWHAVANFVSGSQFGTAPRIEIWDTSTDNTKPAHAFYATRIERYEAGEEPGRA